MWFRPPQSKILATPINWTLPEKLFEDFFFENTFGFILGPWPREGLSSERLSLASDFFVSLATSLVSSTPPLLEPVLAVNCKILHGGTSSVARGGLQPPPIGLSTKSQNEKNTTFLALLRLFYAMEWTK